MPTLPSLRTGTGGYNPAYGGVPAAIGLPSSLYQQAGTAVPALPSLTKTATDVIGSELHGKVSPGTQQYIQQMAAQYGVGAGMPGLQPGSFNVNNLVRSLGLTSEQLTQQGLGHLNTLQSTVGAQQLDPGLQAEIASRNANLAAAPNPEAAARAQIDTLKELAQWEKRLSTPSGATGEFYSPWMQSSLISALGPGTKQIAPGTFSTPAGV